MVEKIKLLAVVGPTASGKTSLAVHLAKKFYGEVVSADSMQIYQKMQIATAKPTPEEMEGIPHHLMDFLPPDTAFSVSDYVSLAREKIDEISKRGALPILAGGTGLYVNSLVDNVSFSESPQNEELRNRLYEEAKKDQGKALYERLCEIDPESAKEIHPNNIIRVVRAVEIYESTGMTMTEQKRQSRLIPSPYDVCMIGLNYRDRQKLYARINKRVDIMMEQGLLKEAKEILQEPDMQTAYNAIGYKELKPYFDGTASLDDCLEKIKQESRRYAKRQLTWFRRDPRIHFLYPDDYTSTEELFTAAERLTEDFLKNKK